MQAGDCYLIVTNTDMRGHEVYHLHILLLDGEEYTNNTIVVQINTFDSPRQDKTVLLKPGDHEFIVRESYVNYKRARVRSIKDIQKNIDEKIAKAKSPIKNDVLEKICEGIMKSPHTSFEVKDIYSRFIFRKIDKK